MPRIWRKELWGASPIAPHHETKAIAQEIEAFPASLPAACRHSLHTKDPSRSATDRGTMSRVSSGGPIQITLTPLEGRSHMASLYYAVTRALRCASFSAIAIALCGLLQPARAAQIQVAIYG